MKSCVFIDTYTYLNIHTHKYYNPLSTHVLTLMHAASLTVVVHDSDKRCVWQDGHKLIRVTGLKADVDLEGFLILENVIIGDVEFKAMLMAMKPTTMATECHCASGCREVTRFCGEGGRERERERD